MKKIKPWFLGILLIAAIIILPSHRRSAYKAEEPEGISVKEGQYPDGTYTGTAIGYQPGLTVEINITNGTLTDVRVIKHAEVGRQFYTRPIKFIPAAIVKAQHTKVDAVGGATSTSKGIMAAVEDALAQSLIIKNKKKVGDSVPDTSLRQSGYNTHKSGGVNIQENQYIDGTYRGTATGYRPGLIVEIDIANGTLTDVRVIKHAEVGRQYYDRPIKFIPAAIVKAQHTKVDVVGGATSTSQGIMAAVEDALAKASLY